MEPQIEIMVGARAEEDCWRKCPSLKGAGGSVLEELSPIGIVGSITVQGT